MTGLVVGFIITVAISMWAGFGLGTIWRAEGRVLWTEEELEEQIFNNNQL